MTRYLRNTHFMGPDGHWCYRGNAEFGAFPGLPIEKQDAAFIVHMLESGRPMTLDEVVEAAREYGKTHNEEPMSKENIAVALCNLTECKMTKIVDGDEEMTSTSYPINAKDIDGLDEKMGEMQKQALAAYEALMKQMQQQLEESRMQTNHALNMASRTIVKMGEVRVSEVEEPAVREQAVTMFIKDGDMEVNFRATPSAMKDPDVRDAFAKARAVLEGVNGRRNARKNPRTS